MIINGINKLTLLDYPKHTACTIFSGGCNFRCPFCHNASLVLRPQTQPVISEAEVLDFLKKRAGLIEGVCLTGGEPTLNPDIAEFIKKIKQLGYLVKLDTNGSRPDVLQNLYKQNLLDYVAMDIKNSPQKYALTVGLENFNFEKIKESARLIMESDIDYEFRTTIVAELHTAEDIEAIGRWLKGADQFYLQAFKDSGDLISDGLHGADKNKMNYFMRILSEFVNKCDIRGLD